jgi:hypothetical protein
MKAIKLEKFSEMSTKEVLTGILNGLPKNSGGANIGEIRYRLGLLEKVESAEDELLLEDAEHGRLVDIVANFPFGIVHRDLVAIADAIENADTVEAQRKG